MSSQLDVLMQGWNETPHLNSYFLPCSYSGPGLVATAVQLYYIPTLDLGGIYLSPPPPLPSDSVSWPWCCQSPQGCTAAAEGLAQQSILYSCFSQRAVWGRWLNGATPQHVAHHMPVKWRLATQSMLHTTCQWTGGWPPGRSGHAGNVNSVLAENHSFHVVTEDTARKN